MCGIFAYKGSKQAAPMIIEGLKRLEYRGYDSCGIATSSGLIRVVGGVSELEKQCMPGGSPSGSCGIGHTRWATHGAVTLINAHPHSDCTGRIQVVHNGVIRNHAKLRAELETQGHIFRSDTDTEIIAHLLETHSFDDLKYILEGDYAFVTLINDELHAVSHGSPLHERIVDGDLYISSDINAIPPYDLAPTKGNYAHWMLKEIMDQQRMSPIHYNPPQHCDRAVFVACGSSYHAALLGVRYAQHQGIPAEAIIASEFGEYPMQSGDALIAVTQSGETADVLSVLRKVKGHKIVVTNNPTSTAAGLADQVYDIKAGVEYAVAATKTFTHTIAVLQAMFDKFHGRTFNDIMTAPDLGSMECLPTGVMFVGHGKSYPVALEGALKLKEVSYINAQAVAAGELKHGALALITDNYPVVCVGECDTAKAEIAARGGRIITVDTGDEISDTIALQVMAYKAAVALGLNPDRPRNLAKSVTVE